MTFASLTHRRPIATGILIRLLPLLVVWPMVHRGKSVEAASVPVEVSLAGEWSVRVRGSGPPAFDVVLEVPRPVRVEVFHERHDRLPVFDPGTAGWVKGARLRALCAQETTTPFLLDRSSLVLRAGPTADAAEFRVNDDYACDFDWGTIGRQAGGRIGADQPVFASYRYAPLRLDSIVIDAAGRVTLRRGEPRAAAPAAPDPGAGERRLANLWIPGRVERLESRHLFPILEAAYPEPPKSSPSPAERWLPKTWKKLRAAEPVRILAWGDSVTDGGYLADPAGERWQEQFVARLRRAFPDSRIELITEAWGGRNTGSYLAEPSGSPKNYAEKVLGVRPDLVVSEFVNDAGLSPSQVEERYSRLLADFRGIGAEWIILTPHYVRPDWMGIDREREIDDDPRPYVAGLRAFAARHGVALADASLRYGRLWRQGIPYTTLMLNSINHPDARGMALFADALMALFP